VIDLIAAAGQYIAAGGNLAIVALFLKTWARIEKVESRVTRLEYKTKNELPLAP
jgi:hypothetical protein